jgi:hypothetical protein
LNSTFLIFYSIELGGSGLRWLKQYVENIPLLMPNFDSEQEIEKLLQERNYSAIDILVYELYRLDINEIEFIESR